MWRAESVAGGQRIPKYGAAVTLQAAAQAVELLVLAHKYLGIHALLCVLQSGHARLPALPSLAEFAAVRRQKINVSSAFGRGAACATVDAARRRP
jgi:hypothetical protein